MPGRDGTGPLGRGGQMTGRGFGFCGNRYYGNRNCYGMGFGRRGYGFGLRYGAGYGLGSGYGFKQNVTEKDFLQNQKEFLESQLGFVISELKDLNDDEVL
jgi:hypothetical protein